MSDLKISEKLVAKKPTDKESFGDPSYHLNS